MLKLKIIFSLWLFLAIVVFSSCNQFNDAVSNTIKSNTTDGDGFGVFNIEFLKGEYDIINGLHCLGSIYAISECVIGDSVIIRCGIDVLDWGAKGKPQVIVKVTSSSTGDVKYVTLVEQGNAVYGAMVPPPPVSFIGRLHVSDVGKEDGSLKVSPDGDIASAEIENSNPKLTKKLNIKGI